MSLELKKFNCNISIALLLLILNNYLLISLGIFNIVLKINLILFFLSIVYFYFKNFKNNFTLKIYFLLFLLICLGTAAKGWDLRSLYLFHAKRIFFDQSLYSLADNYAPFSHNDYPLLFHSFSASFAFLSGYWHEVFPKSAYTFVYLPPIIFLSSYMSDKKYMILLSLLIFFIGTHLFLGGLDGVVALYFVTVGFCFFKIFFSGFEEEDNNIFFFITFLLCIILSLIKNEGMALLILIFITTVFIKIFEKRILIDSGKLIVLFFSFIPIIMWKIFCYKNGITNTDFNLELLKINLINRLLIIDSYFLFFKYLIFSNEKSVIALLFFITSFYLNFDKKLFSFVILLFLFYLLLLLIVYFSTPYELTYHLETSANRVLKSFTFLLAFFSLYNLNIRSFSKTS